jgi:hypothetical protein
MKNEVKFSKQKPPVYERCEEMFGVKWKKGIIMTYGNTIHCKYRLKEPKITHESIHVRQQLETGVEEWWDRYFEDEQFRLDQEVEAYKAEIKWIRHNVKGMDLKSRMIEKIVDDISSEIYGSIVTKKEALELLDVRRFNMIGGLYN